MADLSAPVLLDRAAEAVLIGLILLAPLPFGSVQPGAILALACGAALVAWLVLPRGGLAGSAEALGHGGSRLLAAIGALAALQIVPCPRSIAALLSPAQLRLHDSIPSSSLASFLPLSIDPASTGYQLAKLAAYAAILLSAAALAARRGVAARLLGAIFLVGLFEAVYGSAEYLSGHQHIFGFAKLYYTDAATGTYINQNHYAGALEMSFLIGLGFFLSRLRLRPAGAAAPSWRERVVALLDPGRSRTIALAALCALIGLGLLLSYSRSGVVFATLAALGVIAIDLRVHGDRRRAVGVAALAGIFLALVTLAGWVRVLTDFGRQMTGVAIDEGRPRVWLDALAIIRDFPLLGTGWGTFGRVYPLYRHERNPVLYDHAHNDYLQLVVEAGLPAALLAGLLLAVLARRVWRGLLTARRAELPLLLGAAGGLVSLLLHEITDFNLQIPANAVLFSALAGTLLGALTGSAPGAGEEIVPFGLGAIRRRRPV